LWEETPQGPKPKTVTLTWQTSGGEVRSATIAPALVQNATGETIAQLGLAKALTGIFPKWPPVVDRIARGFPTRDIGIESGAEVVAVNGTLVDNVQDVQRMIRFSYKAAPEGSEEEVVPVPLDLTWRNPGESELQTATVTPEVTLSPTRSQIGLQTAKKFAYAQIGLAFAEPKREIGLIGSCRAAIDSTIHAFEETVFVLKGLFTGQVNAKLIGGPVAILQLSAHVGKEGLQRLFWFCAFLQVNLALLNLLPIPILDGGHIVVSLCEGVSRRSFTLKQREYISYIGAALLIPLFVFVFYNDFDRIGLFDFIKEFFS
jgi:regulator of sigma E protease